MMVRALRQAQRDKEKGIKYSNVSIYNPSCIFYI